MGRNERRQYPRVWRERSGFQAEGRGWYSTLHTGHKRKELPERGRENGERFGGSRGRMVNREAKGREEGQGEETLGRGEIILGVWPAETLSMHLHNRK